MLSRRIQRVGASATLKISDRAKGMKARGIDVVNLSVGEPDFATPHLVKEAGIKAIIEDQTHYTANAGTGSLRGSIVGWLKSWQGLEYIENQILVSSGAKQSLFNLVMALIDEGDKVLIPAPYWVSYPEMVKLAGGEPVILETSEEDGFKVGPNALRSASKGAKLFFLNNPSNPTGAAYTREELEELARVAAEEDLLVVADEIYGKLVYGDFRFTSFAAISEDARRRTIVVNGVSKAYAMTGWRIGFAAGDAEIIKAMAKVQGHATSNACSISQAAATTAFSSEHDEAFQMLESFTERRAFALERVKGIAGLTCVEPQGAFYLFPSVQAYLGKTYKGERLENSQDLAMFLLEEGHVACVPGSAFGAEGFIRFSYAASMDELKKAFDRIEEALGRLAS